jgi:hypothetical protein
MNRVLALSLLLMGCVHQQSPPESVAVSAVVPERQAVPVLPRLPNDIEELLKPCPIARLKEYTGNEIDRITNARGAALTKCNQDKAKLGNLLRQVYNTRPQP